MRSTGDRWERLHLNSGSRQANIVTQSLVHGQIADQRVQDDDARQCFRSREMTGQAEQGWCNEELACKRADGGADH